MNEETVALTSLSSRDKLQHFHSRFLRSRKNFKFLHRANVLFFPQKPTHQSFALVYIDDILLPAHTKPHSLELIEQLHQVCSSSILQIAPEKSFYVLLAEKFWTPNWLQRY